MSLEVALQENTAVLKQLLEKLSHVGAAVAPNTPPAPKAAPQPKAEEKPAAPATTTPPPATEIAYDRDIKPIALALAKKDRNKLLAIYKELGVNVGTEIKPEQFVKAKELIEAASK